MLVIIVGACFLYRSRNERRRFKKQLEVAQETLRGAILLGALAPQSPKAKMTDAGVGSDALASAPPTPLPPEGWQLLESQFLELSEKYSRHSEESIKSKDALQARIAALEEELRAAWQAAKYCEGRAAQLESQLLEATRCAAASDEELNKLRRQKELLEHQLVQVSREASGAARHSCTQQDRLHEFWKKGVFGLEAELADVRDQLATADRELQKVARAKDLPGTMLPPPPLRQPQMLPPASPQLLTEPLVDWQAMLPPPNLESVSRIARLQLDRRRALSEVPGPGPSPTVPAG